MNTPWVKFTLFVDFRVILAQCQAMKINERIKKLRIQNEWTQEYVAEKLGVDRSNYSKYELGKLKLRPEMIVQIAKLFDVSADYLLGLEN